jgi:hypothetical protein
MDRPSLIAAVTPITTLIALSTAIALAIAAASRSGRGHPGPPLGRADDAAPVEYLYVLCVRYHGHPAEKRRWVQEVPIVKKTAKLIYYTSDSWDRRQAVVSPGCNQPRTVRDRHPLPRSLPGRHPRRAVRTARVPGRRDPGSR